MRQVFDADLARILLLDQGPERRLRLGAAAGFARSASDKPIPLAGVLEQVVLGGRSLILDELPAGSGLDRMLTRAQPRALMVSPLTVKGRMEGVIEVGTKRDRRFSAEEESLLVLMADRAGLAIEHARAYQREVGTVELLQRSLLPDRLPDLPGVRIAARYMPGGADVGGDWYDAIPLEDGAVGVAMGDVVGHGLGAASLMGQLRSATRAYALDGHTPAGVLDRLDKLVRGIDGSQMATLLYLVVDADMSRLRFASAGHVPPLVIAPSGTRYLDSAPNPPLGVYGGRSHRELSADLEPGSTIVLYTDGLVEERGVSIDTGLEALRQAASDKGHPEELCDHLVETMLAIHPAHDDIAVLALSATPDAVEPLHIEVSTDPTELREVRRGLASWLRRGGAHEEDVEIAQIACHEACSNAIEHGYSFGDGRFTIDARVDESKLVLEVSDRGKWVERPDGKLPHRGRGLALMEALMDAVELSYDGGGTTVRMERALARARVSAAS
jgi:serine phosphatase RsbU (regulator of sigma subunit)/anti-sigma regulatory factor (Ser/Thr protein kinase)